MNLCTIYKIIIVLFHTYFATTRDVPIGGCGGCHAVQYFQFGKKAGAVSLKITSRNLVEI